MPVDSALALVAQGAEAVKKAFPEVLEQRPIDGLEAVARGRVHRHIQLRHRLQLPAHAGVSRSMPPFSQIIALLQHSINSMRKEHTCDAAKEFQKHHSSTQGFTSL